MKDKNPLSINTRNARERRLEWVNKKCTKYTHFLFPAREDCTFAVNIKKKIP